MIRTININGTFLTPTHGLDPSSNSIYAHLYNLYCQKKNLRPLGSHAQLSRINLVSINQVYTCFNSLIAFEDSLISKRLLTFHQKLAP